MSIHGKPINGNWYQEPATGEAFEVIGVNEAEDVVDVRYLDRGHRRLDFATWQSLHPVQVEGPERSPTDTARAPSAPPPTNR